MKKSENKVERKKYSLDSFPSSVFYEANEFLEIENEIECLDILPQDNRSRRETLIGNKSDFNLTDKSKADHCQQETDGTPINPNESLIYHGFYATVFHIFHQNKHPRDWCLKIITWPWFEQLSMTIIAVNCITLSMYQPCGDQNCETSKCQIMQAFDYIIFAFFTCEMVIKIIAMGFLGDLGYFGDTWNRLDMFIVIVGSIEILPSTGNNIGLTAIRTIRVLRPLRAINRIPSMRILVMLLLDTLPMLGNVLLLCFFVFFIFGIIGVQMWQGVLRNRCYLNLNESFRHPGLNLSSFYQINRTLFLNAVDKDFICSTDKNNGILKCSDIPPSIMLLSNNSLQICKQPARPFTDNLPTKHSCVNWNQYYTDCQPGEKNPYEGAINFDNIGFAWVAIFQVISMESWVDIMYYVQDAHSFWDWIYFVALIIIGSFFMINLCLVVIASQFSETKRRETERMWIERRRFNSSNCSSISKDEPQTCYLEIIKLITQIICKIYRRIVKLYNQIQIRHSKTAQGNYQNKLKRQRKHCNVCLNSRSQFPIDDHCHLYSIVNTISGDKQHYYAINKYPINFSNIPPKASPELSVIDVLNSPRHPNHLISDISSKSVSTETKRKSQYNSQILLEIPSTPANHSTTRDNYRWELTNNPLLTSKDKVYPQSVASRSSSINSCAYQIPRLTDSYSKHRRPFNKNQNKTKRKNYLSICQQKIKTLVNDVKFQRGILIAILINTLSMGIEYHQQPVQLTQTLEFSNIVFSILFLIEMILKLIGEGILGYIKNGFNLFDGIIVVLGVIELCQQGGTSGLSILRTFRLLRILKLVRFMPALRQQLFVMIRTIDNVATFFALLILFIFIFSILGMSLFGCKFCTIENNKRTCDRKNFDSLLWSIVTVFQILTQEDWNTVLYNGMTRTSSWAALYFIALMTFGNYVLFNLLVAILVEGFSSERLDEQKLLHNYRQSLKKRRANNKQLRIMQHQSENLVLLTNSIQKDQTGENQKISSQPPVIIHTAATPMPTPRSSPYNELVTTPHTTFPHTNTSNSQSILSINKSFETTSSRNINTTILQEDASIMPGMKNSKQNLDSTLFVEHHIPVQKTPTSNGLNVKLVSIPIPYTTNRSNFIIPSSILLRQGSINSFMGSVNSDRSKILLDEKKSISETDEKSLSRQSSFKSFMAYKNKINQLTIPFSNRYSLSLDSEGKSNYQFKMNYLLAREKALEEPDDSNSESQNSSRMNNVEDPDEEDMEAMICLSKCCPQPKGIFAKRYYHSLYVFSVDNQFRQKCQHIVDKKSFDYLVLFFITLNCITLAMERPSIPPHSKERLFLTVTNYIFTIIFTGEMIIKVLSKGLLIGDQAYLKSGWNIMDGFLVFISLLDLFITILLGHSNRIFGILRVFRLLRTLRPLRVISRAPGLKLVVQTLLSSLRPIGNIVLICCTFFIIFGILGVQLFKGKFYYCDGPHLQAVKTKNDCLKYSQNEWKNQKYNFDNLGQALMALFVLSSKDGWVQIMYTGIDAVGVNIQPQENHNEWALIYFISFLLLVAFFVLNMFVGVVVENFHKCQENQEKEEKARRAAKRARRLEKKRKHLRAPLYWENYSKWRRTINSVVTSKYFDLAIAGVIGLNVITMATEFHMMPQVLKTALKVFNYFFTSTFVLEALLKLVALGLARYISDNDFMYLFGRWNQLDMMIVILSIAGVVIDEVESNFMPINPTIMRVMRVLRIARVLKLLKMASGIRALLDTVIQALPQVGNLGLLFFLLFYIFAALGVELFGRLECSDINPCVGLGRHAHFENFGMAFLTLFRIATGDNWNGIMKDTLREKCISSEDCQRNCCVSAIIAPIYFVIFVLMAQFVLVNVVVAVLMKHLEESHKMMCDDYELEREVQRDLDEEAKELAREKQLKDEENNENTLIDIEIDKNNNFLDKKENNSINQNQIKKLSCGDCHSINAQLRNVSCQNVHLVNIYSKNLSRSHPHLFVNLDSASFTNNTKTTNLNKLLQRRLSMKKESWNNESVMFNNNKPMKISENPKSLKSKINKSQQSTTELRLSEKRKLFAKSKINEKEIEQDP